MNKQILIVFLLLSVVNQAFTQRSVIDNFNNNKKKWKLVDNDFQKIVIDDGLLIVEVFDDEADAYIVNDFKADLTANFVLECEFTKYEGETGVGFLWGFENEQNYNRFLITTRDQEFNAVTYRNGEVEWISDWTFSEAINLDYQTNKLKIEKKNNRIELYANDQLLTTISDTEMFGNQVGFFVGGTSVFEIDNFSITFDKKTKRNKGKEGKKRNK